MAPLPLLSGPPPRKSSETCRKCSKKFNLLLNRSRTCGHCGFSYCQDHCTHRALTPRQSDSFSLRSGGGSSGSGYEEEHCCGFCISFVKITSLEYEKLEALSIKELKGYISAYNIQIPLGLHEKSEFVRLIFNSRTLNGCLNERREDYFREKTVPPAPSEAPPSTNVFTNFLNEFSDPAPSSSSSRRASNTDRPSPSPQPNNASSSRRPSAPQQQPNSNPPSSRPQPSSNNQRTSPRPPPSSSNNQPRPPPPPSASRASPNPRPRPSPPQPPQPPPTHATRPPTLSELILLQSQSQSENSIIPDLSVRILKSILSTHHVRSDGILEKSELVEKVVRLVREESERLRRMEVEERREELEAAEAGVRAGAGGEGEWEAIPEWILAEGRAEEERRERESGSGAGDASSEGRETEVKTKEVSKPAPPPSVAPAPMAERSGLCVICCDRDAIIASVDCGHLALCSECSDMVMGGNRECPLCRTVMRPAGLLRIYSS
ncbi:hypothetical protein BDY24DRAFT_396859 [Mrakia frigida]|uniref:FYVE domain-containing RING finger protein n=1 Tax=Mrakia frigida TaxID=29902 RepID=UPI003FCC1D63